MSYSPQTVGETMAPGWTDQCFYVAGHRGMVGSALTRALRKAGGVVET